MILNAHKIILHTGGSGRAAFSALTAAMAAANSPRRAAKLAALSAGK